MAAKPGGLRCPLCGAATFVNESRLSNSNSVRRRRQCEGAEPHIFTTYEVVKGPVGPVKSLRNERNKPAVLDSITQALAGRKSDPK